MRMRQKKRARVVNIVFQAGSLKKREGGAHLFARKTRS